jgi:hypothetical protein
MNNNFSVNMNATCISVQDAVDKIRQNGNTFFTVAFTKRTDNSLRIMNARLNVRKGLKGKGRRYNNDGLLPVYDMVNRDYRTVNISGIRWLRLKGKTFIVVN